MPQPGRRVNVFINLATLASPSWSPVGQGTGWDFSEQRDVTRVSHKDSNAQIPISGSISRTGTLSGFYFRNDAGQAAVRTAFSTDTEKQFRVLDTGSPLVQFMAKVSSIAQSHPVDGASTYTVTLEPTETPYNPGS